MMHQTFEHQFDTVVIGGGQAFATGCVLAQQDRNFVMLIAGAGSGMSGAAVGIRFELPGMPEVMAASAPSQ